jgi:hypothetical protein
MVTINFTGVVEVLRFSQVFLLIMQGKRKKKLQTAIKKKKLASSFQSRGNFKIRR